MKVVAFSPDQAMALNGSATHADVTSLSGKPPPGRGAGGQACRGMATKGSAPQRGQPVYAGQSRPCGWAAVPNSPTTLRSPPCSRATC